MTCDMDYSSGADQSLLDTGDSMRSGPNLLPFLAIRSSIHLWIAFIVELHARQPKQPGFSHEFTA